MATKSQKAKAIIDALADPVVVNAAMTNRIAQAFVYTYTRNRVVTLDEAAGLFLVALRNMVKQVVYDAEVSKLMEATRLAADAAAKIDLGSDGELAPAQAGK